MIGSIITAILPTITEVIDRVVPDPGQRLEIERELNSKLLANEAAIFQAASETIKAEASSGNPLASSWRPILMYFFMALIGWIVITATFGDASSITEALGEVPETMWHMLMLGMGGYVFGRSGEKIAERILGR